VGGIREKGVDRDNKNKFRERVGKVDEEVVISTLGKRPEKFSELNTIWKNALNEKGYSTRTEAGQSGEQRRSDPKYTTKDDYDIEGEFADYIENPGKFPQQSSQEDRSDRARRNG